MTFSAHNPGSTPPAPGVDAPLWPRPVQNDTARTQGKRPSKGLRCVILGGLLLGTTACKKEEPAAPVQVSTPTPVPVKADSANRAPVVTAVILGPEAPKTNDTLEVKAEANDADGDAVTYQYQWYLNGERLLGEIGQSYPESKTNHGDRLAVEVIPFDGKTQGAPQRSAELVIKNSAPELVSTLTAGSALDGFKFDVTDADNDPITFSLEGAPPRMSIGPDGVLHWKPDPSDKAGDYDVKVVASDGQGASVSVRFPIHMTAAVNPH